MKTIEAGKTVAADLHIHIIGRGGTRSPKEIVWTVINSNFPINVLAIPSYHELHPYTFYVTRDEASKKGRLALAAVEINTPWGHVELIPRPDTDVELDKFSKEVPKHNNGLTMPDELVTIMWEKFGAIAILVHGQPEGPFRRWIHGITTNQILQLLEELRTKGVKAPIGIELLSGETDKLCGRWNAFRIPSLKTTVDKLKQEGLGVGGMAGSDDHGHTLGEYRTTWLTHQTVNTDTGVFDSLSQAILNGETKPETVNGKLNTFEWAGAVFRIGFNHVIPRIEKKLIDRGILSVSLLKRADLLRTYLLLTGQTTKEGRAWLDEFQTNRDFPFNRGY